MLALLVQGHHGGLRSRRDLPIWLSERRADPAVGRAIELARAAIPDLEPDGPIDLPAHALTDPLGAELLLRLVFSALVDADFLDTERHFDPEQTARRGGVPPLQELWRRLEAAQADLIGRRNDTVGRARDDIYRHCLARADTPPGLFRLTVPTGGGKTRSGLAFALCHALRNGLRRVIVAVPFMTITEQTADTYRAILGSETDDFPIVLEHHSGATWRGDEDSATPAATWARLASENWDAPIIVTTTVQLFESLFAHGTQPSRKLHRLAGSVIILDEAQALPGHVLTPILDALRRLVSDYGTSVVLSTATQPAFESIAAFAKIPAIEIVPAPDRYFEMLRRVTYEWQITEPWGWERVSAKMRTSEQSLAVVNTKPDAMDLLDAVEGQGGEALHLSTLLCGAHRRRVIDEVKARLAKGHPCHLVATQVIEAGVDLDFPLVLRALAPLDSIIQAAGRCNREGLLDLGRVIVFRTVDGHAPPGYRAGLGITGSLLGKDGIDADDPTLAREYFRRLFQSTSLDRDGIQAVRTTLDYPKVAERFRMIDDDTENVVVRYGSVAERAMVEATVSRLRRGAPDSRHLLRRIQPFVVAIRRTAAERFRRAGLVVPIAEALGEWMGSYDDVRGLDGRRERIALEQLVV